jgi:hypothetical protein
MYKFVPSFAKRKQILTATASVLALLLFVKATPVLATAGAWSASGSVIYYTDGNVGIGISAPTSKLQVNGDMAIGNTLSSGQSIGLQFLDTGTQHAGFRWTDDGSRNLTLEDASSGASSASWYTPVPVNFIVRNGKLGVNTSTPQAPLHVTGNDGLINLEGANTAFTQYFPLGYANGRKAWVGFGSSGSNNFTISNEKTGGNIAFMASGGNVIVDATLKAKQVIVQSNVWADYVFDPIYKLLPLPQLKAYIEANKHLPNMPSTAEVKANGISISDMQTKQMEKIEELTLYIIQQDEQLKAQKEMIDKLSERLDKLEQK